MILEALMHRVPVVATAVSGTPELTDDDGGAGEVRQSTSGTGGDVTTAGVPLD